MGRDDDNEWERRREGVALAIQQGYTKEAIARAIGTDGSNLGNLLRRKGTRSKFIPRLDDWLERNVWNKPVPTGENICALLASELRQLADFIESPTIPAKLKRERFEAAVRGLYSGLDLFSDLFGKG